MNDSSSSIAADRCVLCLDEKRSPVHIQCGHSFCYDCLDVYKSYQKHAWANRCPICRGQLKEKKRAVKRKYSTMTNASSENSTSNPTSTITSPLSDNQADSYEQIFMLEEFMAWAAGHNAPNDEGSYVALDNADYDDEANDVTDVVDVDGPEYDDNDDDNYYDDYNDDYYDNHDDDFYDNGDNDQDDVVNFSTDSDDDDDNNYYYQFSEDVTQEYYHSTANVDDNMVAQSPLQQQQHEQHHEQQFMFRDCNNNVSNASYIDPTIDWEEDIEVFIID